ncbi:MAG: cobaltochelatase subunit CobN [Lentisphaerae bacterium]|nr:cobaltochelatase subunit CobN [Lentisphaerota bacterium]
MKILTEYKKYLISGAAVLLIAGLVCWGYFRYASSTRIYLVNYPEYILAPLLDQELNPALDIRYLAWNDKSGAELRDADCVIFFGMGLNFTEAQQKLLAGLPCPVYTTSATRQETALASALSAEQKEMLDKYLRFGGKENFRRMLDYIRFELDGKRIFAPEPLAPEKMEHKPFFHIDSKNSFKTVEEYFTFYRQQGFHQDGCPQICILGGNGGGSLGELIGALEKEQCNVIAVSGLWPGREVMEKIAPDLVIYQPHGRLGDEAVEFLKEKNIPLFCPLKVNQNYEEFLKDQRGMTGGMLSQSITMPELDGGIVPFVLSALYKNSRGLMEFRMIPDRLARFVKMVRKTAALKRKNNADKKIALIYYGSIGKESATAGLGTSQSILNILHRLQKEGYNTGVLPESVEALDKEIKENSAIFGKIGGTKQLTPKHIQTVIITPDEYSSWVKKSMPDDLYSTVVERYGDFPGKMFRTKENNMAIGCIRFGNVILMPQSLPGEGADENKLIHGVKTSPPHTYIATYLYLRHGFKADALMHVGTHGSLEFTPWKQAALSSYDWPDVLIGEIPHYYLYIINNIGEAQIAKRRSYATMISHLTPPFMNSDSYGAVALLQEKLHHYATAENAKLKSGYGKAIIELAMQENIHKDLKLSEKLQQGVLTEDDLLKIQEYLHEINDAKVNRGVYVVGRPYSDAQADETAILMNVDVLAGELFDRDVKAGKVTPEKREDKIFFRNNYVVRAKEYAAEVLAAPEKFKRLAPPEKPAHPGKKMSADAGEMQKMMQSGKLPDGRPIPPQMLQAMQMMKVRPGREKAPEKRLSPEEVLLKSRQDLLDSSAAELDSIVNAFAGGYIYATAGGDPILNPGTVPTGKNLYGIDPERTPTKESFEVGKQLAEELIRQRLKSTGKYPQKVAFSLWGGEFIRTQGVNIGEIFYLLGVEPVWDSRGRVRDVRLIPAGELKRPRIDVVIQTSGQFRGAATSRMKLIDKAVMLAAADPEGEFGNFVRHGSLEITNALIAQGMSPQSAKELSNARIFGGVNGNFGTGAMGAAQDTGKWEDTKGIAELYLNNMSAVYTEGHWGEHKPEMFRAAVKNTDSVVQSRSSNSWGALSLDHVYEFTGGMSLAARHVNGKDPEAYFNDLRTAGKAKVQTAGEAAMVEARSTVLNPKYIREMMKEGAPASGQFAEIMRNTLGWEIMKPDMLDDHLWQEYKEVYVDDKLQLGTQDFFEQNNPAVLHEMTGIMLESVRKGFWKADPETVEDIARNHAELMRKFDLPPVDNAKLQEMIKKSLKDPELRKSFEQQIAKSLELKKTAAASPEQKDVSGVKLAETLPQTPQGESAPALKIIAVIIIAVVAAVIAGNIRLRGRKK